MFVTDVLFDVVFFDYLIHVVQNFIAARDWWPSPRFEGIPKGEEVAIRSDTWVGMGFPGTAKTVHCLKDGEGFVRALLQQMVSPADS